MEYAFLAPSLYHPPLFFFVNTQAEEGSLGFQRNLAAWFCTATPIARLRFMLFRFAWLLRHAKSAKCQRAIRLASRASANGLIQDKRAKPIFCAAPISITSSRQKTSELYEGTFQCISQNGNLPVTLIFSRGGGNQN